MNKVKEVLWLRGKFLHKPQWPYLAEKFHKALKCEDNVYPQVINNHTANQAWHSQGLHITINTRKIIYPNYQHLYQDFLKLPEFISGCDMLFVNTFHWDFLNQPGLVFNNSIKKDKVVITTSLCYDTYEIRVDMIAIKLWWGNSTRALSALLVLCVRSSLLQRSHRPCDSTTQKVKKICMKFPWFLCCAPKQRTQLKCRMVIGNGCIRLIWHVAMNALQNRAL